MRRTIPAWLAALMMLASLAVAQTTQPTDGREAQARRAASQPAEPEPPAGVIRVACVGDSITYGHTIKDRAHDSYPAKLGALLGPAYAVRNYGVNGTTALHAGDRPYVQRPIYAKALAFKADVLVMALGTNDSKPQNWSQADAFVTDYEAIIAAFRTANPAVKIYVVLPPPCFVPGEASIRDGVLEKDVVPKVKQIATDVGATVIDVRSKMAGKPELFPDQIHPNVAGAALYAQTVLETLKGK